MRRIFVASALAAAALGTTAPAASAGCYGAEYYVVACWGGDYEPNPTIGERELVCLYTGGESCEWVYAPWVEVNRPSGRPSVCVLGETCAP